MKNARRSDGVGALTNRCAKFQSETAETNPRVVPEMLVVFTVHKIRAKNADVWGHFQLKCLQFVSALLDVHLKDLRVLASRLCDRPAALFQHETI